MEQKNNLVAGDFAGRDIYKQYFFKLKHKQYYYQGIIPLSEGIRNYGDVISFMVPRPLQTSYFWQDEELISNVAHLLLKHHFFYIYGNSARGKTYFSFKLVDKIKNKFSEILYISPKEADTNIKIFLDNILRVIYDYNRKGSSFLIILDDFHLVPEDFFRQLLSIPSGLRYILLVSRNFNKYILPISLDKPDLRKSFNKYSEKCFEKRMDYFVTKNRVSNSSVIEGIFNDTDGSNLLFLTFYLSAWNNLLQNKTIDFTELKNKTYNFFLEYYERNDDNWKYINHIVSALFQYEIKIDRNFLSPQLNEHLQQFDLEKYLKERSIHNGIDKSTRKIYYVSNPLTDEDDSIGMMHHASEFQFYLNAYDGSLIYKSGKDLSRINYSRDVIIDYLLTKPSNFPEAINMIKCNANQHEKEFILSTIYSNELLEVIENEMI